MLTWSPVILTSFVTIMASFRCQVITDSREISELNRNTHPTMKTLSGSYRSLKPTLCTGFIIFWMRYCLTTTHFDANKSLMCGSINQGLSERHTKNSGISVRLFMIRWG